MKARLILSEATQAQRIQKWNSFWGNNKENSHKWISESSASIGFKPDTHQAFYDLISSDFKTLDLAAYTQIKALSINEFINLTGWVLSTSEPNSKGKNSS